VTVHLEIVSFTHPHVVTIQNTMTFFFNRFFFFFGLITESQWGFD